MGYGLWAMGYGLWAMGAELLSFLLETTMLKEAAHCP
jgi:hypothetical protein